MQELINELNRVTEGAPADFARRELKNPNNRWFVRSALQKAMRRGQVPEALRMAEYMLGTDDAYAWQSLAVVMVEDIGIGDLDALAYSTVLTLKGLRDKLDSADLLYGALVKRVCEGPKSRCCCELELGVNMIMGTPDKYTGVEPDTYYRQMYNHLLNSSEENLLETMTPDSGALNELEAAQLVNLALRKRLRGQGEDALLPALGVIHNELDDPTERRAAMFSFERTVDTMNLALFPILHWLNQRNEDITEYDEKALWPEPKMVGPFWAEVFDMHTKQGKTAIRAWHKHLIKTDDIFKTMEGGEAYKALGAMLFVIEGGLVDRRLRSPGLEVLKKYQDVNFIRGYGASLTIMDSLDEVLSICVEQLPKLHELRLWAYST